MGKINKKAEKATKALSEKKKAEIVQAQALLKEADDEAAEMMGDSSNEWSAFDEEVKASDTPVIAPAAAKVKAATKGFSPTGRTISKVELEKAMEEKSLEVALEWKAQLKQRLGRIIGNSTLDAMKVDITDEEPNSFFRHCIQVHNFYKTSSRYDIITAVTIDGIRTPFQSLLEYLTAQKVHSGTYKKRLKDFVGMYVSHLNPAKQRQEWREVYQDHNTREYRDVVVLKS